MTKTLKLSTEIPQSRELLVRLPADVPPGAARLVIEVTSPDIIPPPKLGELLHSDFFGMWSDRKDIDDSSDFAQRLRRKAWSRA